MVKIIRLLDNAYNENDSSIFTNSNDNDNHNHNHNDNIFKSANILKNWKIDKKYIKLIKIVKNDDIILSFIMTNKKYDKLFELNINYFKEILYMLTSINEKYNFKYLNTNIDNNYIYSSDEEF